MERSRTRLLALAWALTVAAALPACRTDYPVCHADDYAICTCADGSASYGYQRCLADESGYGACVCDGTTPGLDAGCGGNTGVACAPR